MRSGQIMLNPDRGTRFFEDLKFTNDEIAFYDVGIGFWD